MSNDENSMIWLEYGVQLFPINVQNTYTSFYPQSGFQEECIHFYKLENNTNHEGLG